MRIIAGKHRSRILKEFRGRDVRPTSDRAREALFNIIRFRLEGCSFLDLYCGTGAIGIEAISRGAAKVTFVDNAAESVKLTKENLATLKETGYVVKSDALSFVSSVGEKFDVIFLDPPYDVSATDVLSAIAEEGILGEGGLVVYEHKEDRAGEEIAGLKRTDTRKYGIAVFEFYEAAGENDGAAKGIL